MCDYQNRRQPECFPQSKHLQNHNPQKHKQCKNKGHGFDKGNIEEEREKQRKAAEQHSASPAFAICGSKPEYPCAKCASATPQKKPESEKKSGGEPLPM
ncbi:MAG: hypothetical protein KH365_00295 [Clostridiales bacterium]|nr:hypothetical protein [Clostridiales bacterium]